MEWILQIQNSSVLYWFLTNGGVMILATWLSQAASEEQTSVLNVILKVLCHLPLQRALPVHMSAILQGVNKLRFYRKSDISNRARMLLARWSKAFAKSQAVKKRNGMNSAADAQDEMLLKQSIDEVMGNEARDSKVDYFGNALIPFEYQDNLRKFRPSQPLKLIAASTYDNKRRGVLSSRILLFSLELIRELI
ncbi:homeobox protein LUMINIDEPENDENS-like isoform X3 [Olea europaea var. sylvestris]|nr:homeobox protein LUMINIDEPENDENS-like isoform X3 [Olea europaea var. sylvestris]